MNQTNANPLKLKPSIITQIWNGATPNFTINMTKETLSIILIKNNILVISCKIK